MTLTNSIHNVKPPQYITVAHCDGIGWYVVRQDDARMTRQYSAALRNRIVAMAEAIKMAQSSGWKLVIV